MRTIWLHRQVEKEHGSAWTFYVRLGRLFFEINFGRDRTRLASDV